MCSQRHSHSFGMFVLKVYYGSTKFVSYESIKWELKIRPTYDCRCDERLKTKAEDSTRLTYTGFRGYYLESDQPVNKKSNVVLERWITSFTTYTVHSVVNGQHTLNVKQLHSATHPRTVEASRDFCHTGRILCYNSWKENFGKLQMYCSEFHEWLIHLNKNHDAFYCPYTLVPDP
jgi:hypothetical protein